MARTRHLFPFALIALAGCSQQQDPAWPAGSPARIDEVRGPLTPAPDLRTPPAPGSGAETPVAEYTCPMHPEVRSQTPGSCPICGMDLIPVETESTPSLETRAPAPELPEAKVVLTALENNRELQALRAELGVAQGWQLEASLPPNLEAEVELAPERQSQLEFRLEYSLTEALLSGARSEAPRLMSEQAKLRIAEGTWQVVTLAKIHFARLQGAERRITLGRKMVEAYAAAEDAARALSDSGNVPLRDLAAQSAALERAKLVLAELEVSELEAREALVAVLGVSGEKAHFAVPEEPEEVPHDLVLPEDLEERVLGESLALKQALTAWRADRAQAAYLRAHRRAPDVAVDAHALWQTADPLEPAWRIGGGIRTTLPIWNLGQGAIRSADATAEARLRRYEGSAAAIRAETRTVGGRLRNVHARLHHLRAVALPAQKKLSAEMLLQYNAMTVSVFELLRALQAELDLDIQETHLTEDYWSTSARLEGLLHGVSVGIDNSKATNGFGDAAAQGGH